MNVSAHGWGNGGHMMGSGMMNGAGANDAESQKFLAETKDIRVQVAADRAELNALMAGQNPDSKRVRELSESIAANQITLQEKSQAYGWGNGRMNGGRMMGPGMMNGGYGNCMW
jgi:Spy/CpxP family protein refolding chaperone